MYFHCQSNSQVVIGFMKSLEGKIIFVTGANGGLGRQFTEQFLQEGAKLILTDINESELQKYVNSLEKKDNVLGFFAEDISTPDGAKSIFEHATKISKEIDMLVNNAGIAHAGEFAEIPLESVEQLMQINLLGPMRLCHHFLPGMKKRGTGHIVNVSSIAGIVPLPGGAPYSASKFGLKGFSDVLRTDYSSHGIFITSVHPFFTRTAILDSARYGSAKVTQLELPEFLIEDPVEVIQEVITGIKSNREVIYPGVGAKALSIARRLFPDVVDFANKYLG